MFKPFQTQTQETTQLANITQNQINPNTSQINAQNNSQIPGNHINVSPKITVTINKDFQSREGDTTTYVPPEGFSRESLTMSCPFCKKPIRTKIKKSTNMKALLIAIGTCFCGFACMQVCNNKAIDINDYEHSCPNCSFIIGTYFAV